MTGSIDAAIFDLDGVVTFTARLHAATWKRLFDEYLRTRAERNGEPFREFTDADYRAHVDGRPRLDGVRTFLASRGITLPDGGAADPVDAETIHALGLRKNTLFQTALDTRGVDVDANAVEFIRSLRDRGIRVGVASSSRNTETVLQRVGLEDLFEARVDGVVSEQLGLDGKPAPDIFLHCMERLGVADAARAIVVEDADAGVAAGHAGGFGLVLGVNRGGRAIALREHGADWVISDFSEIDVDRIEAFVAHKAELRPNAIAHWSDIVHELNAHRPAVFLDYDGTLTPIVARPDLALLSDEMRATLRALSASWPTTIVSGRGREDVTDLVGIDTLTYAGSHGFDIAGPAIGTRLEVQPGLEPVIAAAAAELDRRTRDITGVIVENKKFAAAVHYRLVNEARVPEIEAIVDAAVAARPQLRKALGKMVFELRPAMEWDKGRAVLWLLQALALDGADVMPVYVGDDVTDEDAFAALHARGIGVLVAEIPRPTAARYSVQNVAEVRELLQRIAAWEAP